MNDSAPVEWIRADDRSLLHTRVFDVRASEFRHPARSQGQEFIVMDAPDWVVVAPVTPEGNLVLVWQYRFGIQGLSLELPGGVIETRENPRNGAVRELAEETGYQGDAPVLLGSVHPNPAIQSNRAHLMVMPNVRRVQEPAWDSDEEIALQLTPVDEVLAMGHRGEITHALMLNMLFLLEPWWREHRPGDEEI